jgi:EAL domain-containing protein (putative c-di-GMP-specific phosphodiesterase class I)
MDIQTIAEFVEDDATMQVLSLLGIDYAQGYGIAMPRPLDSFLNPNTYLESSTETLHAINKPELKVVVG